MPGVYKIITDNNFVHKYLKKETEIGYIIYQSLKNSVNNRNREKIYFNELIKNGHTLPIIGKHIVKGYLYKSIGNYYSPIIKGNLLSNFNIKNLSNNESFHLLYSVEELLIP